MQSTLQSTLKPVVFGFFVLAAGQALTKAGAKEARRENFAGTLIMAEPFLEIVTTTLPESMKETAGA